MLDKLEQDGVATERLVELRGVTFSSASALRRALDEEGAAAETMAFAEGWLDDATGEYLGRPVDVAQLPDGSIIISDDFAGALYRIWYEG